MAKRATYCRHLMIAGLILVPVAQVDAAGRIKLNTGLDFSSGDYGETNDTEITYLPVTLKYSSHPWILKLTLPYLHISGPSTLVGGIDGAEVTNANVSELRSSSGPGDVVVSAAFALDSLFATQTYLDLIAKIKLPTASEKEGLGTGETDAQIQLDVAKVVGKYTPFTTIGLKFPGNAPDTRYQTQLLGSLGLDYKLNEKTNLGLLYDYRDASTDTSSIRSESLLYLNRKISKRLSINSYVVKGFSDNSPDVGGGIMFSWAIK